MSLKLDRIYSCDSGDFIRMAAEVLDIKWNEASMVVGNAGIHGEDGTGYISIYLDKISEIYSGDTLKVLQAIKEANSGVEYFRVIDD